MNNVPKISSLKKEIQIWADSQKTFLSYITPNDILNPLESILDRIVSNVLLEQNRISIGVTGLRKTGKSTFLNALIGLNILESDENACTSFATKIRPGKLKNNDLKFYEETNPDIIYTDEKQIKEKINEINQNERKKESSKDVWILETGIKAFSQETIYEEIKEFYEYIEIIDLPGINDNIINEIDLKNKEHNKKIEQEINEDENEINFEKEIVKTKFHTILEKINLDGIILLFNFKEQDSIPDFIKFFKYYIFKSSKKSMFLNIFDNKNIMLLVNKYEPYSVENKEENEKNKKNIENSIYQHLLYPQNSFLLKMKSFFSSDFKSKYFDKKLGYNNQDDFKKKCELLPIRFISSKSALEDCKEIDFETEKKFHIEELEFGEKEAEEEVKKMIIEQKNNFKYCEHSNFEEVKANMINIIARIAVSKIVSNLKDVNDHLIFIEGEKIILDKIIKEDKKLIIQNSDGIFERMILDQKQLEEDINNIIKNFEDYINSNVLIYEDNINEIDLFDAIKTIFINLNKAISEYNNKNYNCPFQNLIKFIQNKNEFEKSKILIVFNELLKEFIKEVFITNLADPNFIETIIYFIFNKEKELVMNPANDLKYKEFKAKNIIEKYFQHMNKLNHSINGMILIRRNLILFIKEQCDNLKK